MSASFWSTARAAPDRIAVIDTDDRAITAGALLAEVDRLSHAFSARGLVPGDAIAFDLTNRVELLEVYLAALQCGLYVTPINTHLLHGEVAHILADSGAKLCFYESATAEAARAACTEVGLAATDTLCVNDEAYRAFKSAQPATEPHARRLGAAFLYTSGTTGRPKGVRRPLPIGAPEDALRAEYYLGLYGIAPGGDQVHLVCAPLHHGAALNWCVDHLHLGHAAVLREKWTPEGMLAAIEAHRVTATMVVPTHFKRLLALPAGARTTHDLSSLRHVIHTGAPCAPDVKQQMMAWWGPVIYEVYAASEGAATMVTPAQWLARPGTVGKAFPFARVRVLRPDGTDCAPGEPGEVYIRHAGSRFSYHNDRDKTERAWRDAFFTVGDIGYVDAEGYLFLCDRSSDVIVSGGVNIYPSEIEQVLGAHPAVADAAVIGTPDDEWGERVTALVALAPGATASDELVTELATHCRARLAGFKCPRTIEVVASLPRGDNGKLARRELREPYWRGRSRAI
ncbi:MAG TPA: AMP-binding protein [Kofleriaceae bacterium]|jgi:long-chain acyl-CoA synthetase|nr:AMP-binding protein [Kofleriaceae bacterium]